MAQQDEIRNTLARLKELASGGFALAFHVRYTTPSFLFQTYPKPWLDYYSQNGLVLSDPTVAWGFENTGAIRWSVLAHSDTADVLKKAAEFDLNFGLTCAVEDGPHRSIGSFSRTDREFTDAESALLVAEMAKLHQLTADLKTLSPETAAQLRMMSVQFTHT
ncbi:MAG: autoinducer binding domain-containing protein [Yoonia sp.]|nr:autoinducer binding domain-containing protein [Yoonia sp.]MDG1864026.1 autoinducer binding domain-containing protein [Yoonia sp.]